MADGKWINELKATTPVVDAARRVLSVRLEVVQECLPHALHDWKDDPEHVHQLRVSTRRAGAALAIFADAVPGKPLKRIKKHLRRLRRAAGHARDWDVLGQGLAERVQNAPIGQRPGLDFLIGIAHAQRVAAQAVLEETGGRGTCELERLIADTIAAVRRPDAADAAHLLGEAARQWLSEILNDLHAAAADNLDQYEHLHQVRILGKRLRYGMEVFAPCFNADFKDRYYPMVVEMQDILGLANDSYVAAGRLVGMRDVLRGSLPAMWNAFAPAWKGCSAITNAGSQGRYCTLRSGGHAGSAQAWKLPWTTWCKAAADKCQR